MFRDTDESEGKGLRGEGLGTFVRQSFGGLEVGSDNSQETSLRDKSLQVLTSPLSRRCYQSTLTQDTIFRDWRGIQWALIL